MCFQDLARRTCRVRKRFVRGSREISPTCACATNAQIISDSYIRIISHLQLLLLNKRDVYASECNYNICTTLFVLLTINIGRFFGLKDVHVSHVINKCVDIIKSLLAHCCLNVFHPLLDSWVALSRVNVHHPKLSKLTHSLKVCN